MNLLLKNSFATLGRNRCFFCFVPYLISAHLSNFVSVTDTISRNLPSSSTKYGHFILSLGRFWHIWKTTAFSHSTSNRHLSSD